MPSIKCFLKGSLRGRIDDISIETVVKFRSLVENRKAVKSTSPPATSRYFKWQRKKTLTISKNMELKFSTVFMG